MRLHEGTQKLYNDGAEGTYAESTTESTKCMQREDNHINISNVVPMLAKVCIQMYLSELGQC